MKTESNRTYQRRILALAGPVASLFFATFLICFAALRSDGYTHGTKAVSELGEIGASLATPFNILVFIIPGALIFVLSVSILKATPPKTGRTAITLLALSGISMMLVGLFPVDMDNQASFTSTMHFIGAISLGLFWGLSLIPFRSVLRKHLGFDKLGRITPWFLLFLLTNIGWQVVWQTTGLVLPGWGQRIGFFGYFLWVFWVGMEIYRSPKMNP